MRNSLAGLVENGDMPEEGKLFTLVHFVNVGTASGFIYYVGAVKRFPFAGHNKTNTIQGKLIDERVDSIGERPAKD